MTHNNIAGPTMGGHGAKPASRSKRPGVFTLIEMLVVLAVISILAAMLLPALGVAKAVAIRTCCANNLKQVGMGMLSYNPDYDGYFPPYYNGIYWPQMLVDSGYFANRSGINCPNTGFYGTNYPRFSYGYSYLYIGSSKAYTSNALPSLKVSEIRNTNTVLLTESWNSTDPDTKSGWYIADPCTNGYNPIARHSGGFNVAWLDGHTSPHPLADLYGQLRYISVGASDNNVNLWNPKR